MMLLTNIFPYVFDAASYAHITGLINGIEPLNGSNYVSWKEKLEIN